MALGLALGCSEQHEARAGQFEPRADSAARAAAGEPASAVCSGLPEAVRERWLVFDSNRDERSNRDLYMVRADGSERTRLTRGPGIEREPTISPDGTRLAYVLEQDGVALIYVYDFRTGEVRQITPSPDRVAGRADWFDDNPAWFPDSKRLVFHRGRALLVIDSEGGPEHQLANGPDANSAPWDGYKNPVVTPDGREVVCDIYDQIFAFDVETGARRQLVFDRRVRAEAPSLSLDGSQLVYSTVCTDSDLQLVLAPTRERFDPCKMPRITPTDGSRAINAAWGPGDIIAYERDPDHGGYASSIALVKRGAAPCVFDSAGAHEANPAWAPADFELPGDFSPF